MNAPLPDDVVILLVEDRADDIFLVRRAFRELKLRNPLYVLTDAEEAFSYLTGIGKYSDRSRFPLPDILLLDLKMPRMDGFELLKLIRQRIELNPIRILVLTSSQDIYDVNRAYALGANSFLVKPHDFEDFRTLIRTLAAFWLHQNKIVPPGQIQSHRPAQPP